MQPNHSKTMKTGIAFLPPLIHPFNPKARNKLISRKALKSNEMAQSSKHTRETIPNPSKTMRRGIAFLPPPSPPHPPLHKGGEEASKNPSRGRTIKARANEARHTQAEAKREEAT